MSLPKYILQRTVVTIVLIFVVATTLFVFFRQIPGSFTNLLIAEGLSPNRVTALEENWGLTEPLYVQYYNFMVNMFSLDAGVSFQYREDVWSVVYPRLINTIVLVLPAIMAVYVWSSLFGLLMGLKRDTIFEKAGVSIITSFRSIPEYYLAIVLVVVFSVGLGWFPSSEMLPIGLQQELAEASMMTKMMTFEFWHHYTLPFLAVFLYYQVIPSLTMRTSVVETLGQDFFYYHRVKGVKKTKKLKRIVKHSSLPLITLLPTSLAKTISGVVLIEVVFNWPGIGTLLVSSVVARDYPVIQFIFLLSAVFVIIGNYVIDITYSFIDPRITIE